MFPAHLRRLMTPLVLPIAVAGCGKGPPTVPLRGTVTLDGQPLAEATVQFIAPGSRRERCAGHHGRRRGVPSFDL